MTDETTLFSRAELVAAFCLVLPRPVAEEAAQQLLPSHPASNCLSPVQLSDDVVDLLSLSSEDCAARVENLLGLSPEAAAARRAAARERLHL
jgi:hypothetical protein